MPALADVSVVFIDTVAGSTRANNTPAKQTPLIQPQAVWVSPTGDLYISDGNFLVWRVRGGTATIVAGGGNVVDDSVPVPATRARLDFPSGIVGGAGGEIYVSDVRHHRVRRINPNGTIQTVVGAGTEGYSGDGGRATFAELDGPNGLAIGPAGQLFIADSQNYVVRRYDPRSGLITTFAGTGVNGSTGDGGPATRARLGVVHALAFDTAGSLYVSDATHSVIRKVAPDGTISTVAGNGKSGFSGDGGRATDASISNVQGLAVDAQGNLYISDWNNSRIRRVTPAGIISTWAGQSQTRNRGAENLPALQVYLDFPCGLAVDTTGNLFIAEDHTNLIRRVDARTGTITTVAGTNDPFDGAPGRSVPLIRPTDVARDSRGNVYIADNGHFRVRRLDAVSGQITTVAGDGIEAGEAGFTANSIGGSLSISVDPLDRLLIADAAEQVIRRVENGRMTTIIDLSEDNSRPAAVIADDAGNIYVTDRHYHQIYRWAGREFSVLAGVEDEPGLAGDGGLARNAKLNGPEGMALDGKNGLLFCDTKNHVVRRIDLVTGIITRFAGDGLDDTNYDGHPAVEASLEGPIAITLNPNTGAVFIADADADQIRYVNSQGVIDTVAGSGHSGFEGDGGPAILALFDTPLGITYYDGALYVCDSFNYRIRKMSVQNIPLKLNVSPTRFSFRGTQGAEAPSPQLMVLQSSYVGLNFDWKLTAPGFTGDWLYASYLEGGTPDVILLWVDPGKLAPGTYTATIVASSDYTADVRIPVELIIDPPNVASAVTLSPSLMTFTVPRDGSGSQSMAVTSAGGNPLDWRLRVLNDSPWLKFSATSGTTPSNLTVEARAAGLESGSYTAVVYFETARGVSLFVVTMVVSQPKASLQLDRDILVFEAVEGSTRALPQNISIYNTGTGDMNWEVAVPGDSPWVRLSNGSGSVPPGTQATQTSVLVDPSGVRAGVYNATLTVRANGALGSPQLISVRLKVKPADTPAHPVLSRKGLVFRGSPGESIPEQSLELGSTGGVLSYTAKVNDKWLNVTPLNGTVVSSAQRSSLRYLVKTTGLDQGVLTTTVQYSFSDGSVEQVAVTLILKAGATRSTSAEKHPRGAGCVPTQQVMITTSLGNNFFGAAGWPMLLHSELYDDCGVPLTDSTVTVTFSNNDPAKTLTNLRNGQYTTTWTPRAPAASVTLTMQAKHAVLPGMTLRLGGSLGSESDTPPVLAAGGVVNAASRRNASLIASGEQMALTGAFFPDKPEDVSVLVNGSPVKVLSTSAGEIRVLAPDFADAPKAAVMVKARGISTSAELLTVVPVDPGLFAPEQEITAPAGGTLTVNATGLSNKMAVTAQVDDADTAVQSATAGPDGSGIYSLKIAVPAGSAGKRVLTIKSNGVISNGIPITVQ